MGGNKHQLADFAVNYQNGYVSENMDTNYLHKSTYSWNLESFFLKPAFFF